MSTDLNDLTCPQEGLAVAVNVCKVLLRLLFRGGPEPFVVLYLPPRGVDGLRPGLVLRHGVERPRLVALGSLHSLFPGLQIHTI